MGWGWGDTREGEMESSCSSLSVCVCRGVCGSRVLSCVYCSNCNSEPSIQASPGPKKFPEGSPCSLKFFSLCCAVRIFCAWRAFGSALACRLEMTSSSSSIRCSHCTRIPLMMYVLKSLRRRIMVGPSSQSGPSSSRTSPGGGVS